MAQTKTEVRRIDKRAEAIFRHLIEDVAHLESKIVGDNPSRSGFMAVHVQSLGRGRWSIAHYFKQNGDLCCDPDMVFQIDGDSVIVCEYQQAIPPLHRNADHLDLRQVRGMTEFANQWMRNIAEQQELKIG